MLGWKQPTPVDILYNKNIDTLTRMVFLDLWIRAKREDTSESFWHGNKYYMDELVRRGECIFNVTKVAGEIGVDTKKVRKCIDKLQKWYTNLEINRKAYGLLIRFKNYDSMMSMDIKKEINRRSIGDQSERLYKEESVKNGENERERETPPVNFLKKMQEEFPGLRVQEEYEKFRARNLSEGRYFKDEGEGFRLWLLRGRDHQRTHGPPVKDGKVRFV